MSKQTVEVQVLDELPLMLHQTIATGTHPDLGEFKVCLAEPPAALFIMFTQSGGGNKLHGGTIVEINDVVRAMMTAWEAKEPAKA